MQYGVNPVPGFITVSERPIQSADCVSLQKMESRMILYLSAVSTIIRSARSCRHVFRASRQETGSSV